MSKILAFAKSTMMFLATLLVVIATGTIKKASSNKLETSKDLEEFIKVNGFVIDCDEYGRIIIHTNMVDRSGKLEQLPLPIICEGDDFEYVSEKNKGLLYFSPTFIDLPPID